MVIPEVQPPATLLSAVLARVAAARRAQARMQFALLSAFSCIATILLLGALEYAVQEFYTSGFYDYLSLAFTDGSIVLGSREFALSLIDSLPSLAILMLIATACALAWSLTRATRVARVAFRAV